MKKILILSLLSLMSVATFAQKSSAEISKNVKQANLLMLEQNYTNALKFLMIAYHLDSLNANINYKIGVCYLNSSSHKRNALAYLEEAANNVSHNYDMDDPLEKKAPEDCYSQLGIAYRVQNKFNESNMMFGKYKDLIGTKNKILTDELERNMQINLNATEYTLDANTFKVTNLPDSINTKFPEYTPVLSGDESTLYFTSRRPTGTGKETTDEGDYYEDVYSCEKKSNGDWGIPKPMPLTINSVDNEAIVSVSADGLQMFVARDVNGGDIYYSSYDGTQWSRLGPLGITINSKGWETFATLSKDGNTLYFVSDRPGGQGGRDIWWATKLPNGQWSEATNMGAAINTAFDEESPYLTPDEKTIYFSSRGHKTMGGFDIYKSTFGKDGNWSAPENLKPPINTTDDDLYYVQSSNGNHIYFSSSRLGGKGDKDIWMINNDKPEKTAILKGTITFDGTNKIPDVVHINVSDKSTGAFIIDVAPNKSTGSYIITARPGKKGAKLTISYESPGFQTVSQTIEVPSNSTYEETEKVLMLKNINLESRTAGTINVSGSIKDNTGKPIKGSAITVKNNTNGQLLATYYTTPDSGAYYFILKSGENYNLSFEADGYLFQSANVNIPKSPEYSVISKNIVLEKLIAGAKIILNNIFFDSNKSTLRSESNSEIEKVVAILKNSPAISMEIQGHTDNKGNADANLQLSQQRAQSVLNELVKKGITANRLTAKGFGSTVPLASNTLPNGKPDEKGMQQNRRVEVKIVQTQ